MKTAKEYQIKYPIELTHGLVSICIPVWNGEMFLREAILSLLNQTYSNIEVIVLDNLSTDKTSDICQELSNNDKRLRYILDTEMVGDPEGHWRVAQYATGEYFMVACDDDVYEPNYIEELMIEHERKSVVLSFSNRKLIGEDGDVFGEGLKSTRIVDGVNIRNNICKYLMFRNPIPISFGLIRTEVHLNAINYFYRLDDNWGDHDNQYVLSVLTQGGVSFVNKVLFYYRQKDRSNQLVKQSYFSFIVHQLKFSVVSSRIINDASLCFKDKVYCNVSNWASFFVYIGLGKFVSRIKRFF